MPPVQAAMLGAREVGCDAALDEPLAGRGVRLDPVHGRHRRAPVPRVLDHAGGGDPDLARRLADADADAVRALAAASRRGRTGRTVFQRISDGGFGWLLRGYDQTLGWALGHAPLVICLLLGVMALNVHLYIEAPKSFLPQQDTGQIGGFIRGDDGMSFQVMQPKIETFRKAVLAGSRRSRAWPASSAAAAASTTRRRSSASSRSPSARSRRRSWSSASARTCRWCRARSMWLFVEQDIRFGGGGGGGCGLPVHAAGRRHAAAAARGAAKVRTALRDLPELTGISDELVSSQQVTLTVDRAAARAARRRDVGGDAGAQQRLRPAAGLDDLQRAEPVSRRDGSGAGVRAGAGSARSRLS